jgi:predicted MFS family arabinose efflux permease
MNAEMTARIAPSARFGALSVLTIGRIAVGYQFQSVASSAGALVSDLGLDYTTVGTLIGLYTLPGLGGAFLAGIAGKRYGSREVVALGLIVMAVGAAMMAVSTGPASLMIGRLISGVGGIILLVLLLKMVADWFPENEVGLAMAVGVNGWPIGIGLGMFANEVIIDRFGWRSIFWGSAAFALLALALMLSAYPSRSKELRSRVSAADNSTFPRPSELLGVAVAGCAFALFNVSALAILSFTPAFLQATGFDRIGAASVMNLHLVAGVAGVLLGGVLATKLLSNATRFAAILVLCLVTTAIATAFGMGLIPASGFILMGIISGIPISFIVLLPAQFVSPNHREVAFGIFFTIFYVGLAALMPLVGFARDAWGQPNVPIFVAAALYAGIPFVAAYCYFRRSPQG